MPLNTLIMHWNSEYPSMLISPTISRLKILSRSIHRFCTKIFKPLYTNVPILLLKFSSFSLPRFCTRLFKAFYVNIPTNFAFALMGKDKESKLVIKNYDDMLVRCGGGGEVCSLFCLVFLMIFTKFLLDFCYLKNSTDKFFLVITSYYLFFSNVLVLWSFQIK